MKKLISALVLTGIFGILLQSATKAAEEKEYGYDVAVEFTYEPLTLETYNKIYNDDYKGKEWLKEMGYTDTLERLKQFKKATELEAFRQLRDRPLHTSEAEEKAANKKYDKDVDNARNLLTKIYPASKVQLCKGNPTEPFLKATHPKARFIDSTCTFKYITYNLYNGESVRVDPVIEEVILTGQIIKNLHVAYTPVSEIKGPENTLFYILPVAQ